MTPPEMPLKDGSFSKSSKILAAVAFGESGLLSCSGKFAVFFLCSTLHSSPLFFHFHDRCFGNSERIDFVSYYLPYSTLVFVRKCRGNFTLDYFDIFFHLFENNCSFGRCKLWFSGALCRGRSNILCRVVSQLARASEKIT